jgi:membrane associated rhomboid family serine protease
MLFVPVWDMNHLRTVRFPYVTTAIIIANTLVFFLFQTRLINPSADPEFFTRVYALTPSLVTPADSFLRTDAAHFRLVTHMFLHGNILHLVGNMLFLFVFGDNVEDAMGHVRFLLFYIVCGVFAAVTYSFLTTVPDVPLIGASGAVAGVIGAYVMLHPNVRVWVLMPTPILPFLPLRFSAGFVIAAWVLYQIASAFLLHGSATAWWAHIGGFLAGAAMILFTRRPGVRLFDKATGV